MQTVFCGKKIYHPSYFPTAYTRSSFAQDNDTHRKEDPVDVPFVVTKITELATLETYGFEKSQRDLPQTLQCSKM